MPCRNSFHCAGVFALCIFAKSLRRFASAGPGSLFEAFFVGVYLFSASRRTTVFRLIFLRNFFGSAECTFLASTPCPSGRTFLKVLRIFESSAFLVLRHPDFRPRLFLASLNVSTHSLTALAHGCVLPSSLNTVSAIFEYDNFF